MSVVRFPIVLAWILLLSPGPSQQPVAMSLLGTPLFAPSLKKDARREAEAALAAARKAVASDPSNVESDLALGAALTNAGQLVAAVEAYTLGAERHGDEARLYLARGRVLKMMRKLEPSLRDFRKAAETLPEARCDVAFVTYVKGDFGAARDAYKACPNSPWGPVAEARVTPAAQPPAPPAVTDKLVTGYYEALPALVAKDIPRARELLTKITDKFPQRWMEDTYLAAEADLARLPKKKAKSRK